MLWLYIDFPSLQLDCLKVSKNKVITELDTTDLQAIVIVDATKNSIVQLNESAINQGIKLGMGLAMAASLADKLCVLPYNVVEEKAYLMTLAEQLYSVTANIALFPPHGLALQVNDMLRLYQGLEHYVATVRSVLDPFKLSTYIACGFNPMSAQLLACAGISLLTAEKSKITDTISALTIQRLFISHKAKENLARIGIETIAQLQTLPIAELAKRLDIHTIDYLAQLNGKISKSLMFYQPKHLFEHSIELLYEISVIDVLLQPINQLLSLLEAFLKRRDYLCLQIKLTLFNRTDGLSHTLQQSLLFSSAAGEYLAKNWLNLVTLKLASVKLRAPITKVTLRVKQFQANTGEVDDIFLGRRGQLSFAQLVSLLVNKLGHEKILGIQLGNDHRAELASHYFPLVSQNDDNHNRQGLIYQDANENNRMQHKPLSTNQSMSSKPVIDPKYISPSFINKLPQRPSFILAKPEPLLFQVSVLQGPERIETAWWEQAPVQHYNKDNYPATELSQHYQRDYFIAKNAQGQCCWVYRQLNNQWYVHGYFS